MQISQINQSIHYEDDLYNLDIEFKTVDSSINLHENVNLTPTTTTNLTNCCFE
ncbi:MAG: hypothetical protein ACRDDW_04635 [Candidatus Rhabdochlamydia sp.]